MSNMTVQYGLLKGKVVGGVRAEDMEQRVKSLTHKSFQSNHFHILVQAAGGLWRCPVNVRSQDGSEVWFKIRDAFTDHPIVQDLPGLPEDLTELPNRRPGRTLDFLREPLFDRTTMRHLPIQAPAQNDDVQDHL